VEVSPQFCVVQQELEEPILAQEKPELPSILHRLEGLKVRKVSGRLVSWLLSISNFISKLSWPISDGTVVIELSLKYKYSKFAKSPMIVASATAPAAARIQVVTASIVLCGRYRQLSNANGRESGDSGVIMLWGRVSCFSPSLAGIYI